MFGTDAIVLVRERFTERVPTPSWSPSRIVNEGTRIWLLREVSTPSGTGVLVQHTFAEGLLETLPDAIEIDADELVSRRRRRNC